MTETELADGYAWCYRRLFSHRSIWRRRPDDARALLPYLAMAYLYKRANPLWAFLIRHRLVGPVWRPVVELTRRRHLASRFQSALVGWVAPDWANSLLICARRRAVPFACLNLTRTWVELGLSKPAWDSR